MPQAQDYLDFSWSRFRLRITPMTFNLINRRTHLYLAMFLLPWFLVNGISSIPFSHHSYFRELYRDGIPQWTVRFERDYDRPVPHDANLRKIGAQILQDLGLEGAFCINRPNRRRLNIYLFDFWSPTGLPDCRQGAGFSRTLFSTTSAPWWSKSSAWASSFVVAFRDLHLGGTAPHATVGCPCPGRWNRFLPATSNCGTGQAPGSTWAQRLKPSTNSPPWRMGIPLSSATCA